MGFFKRQEMEPLFFDLPEIVHYESVLEYLKGLSQEDFDIVVKVASIYRQAEQEAADALDIPLPVTSYIVPPTIKPNYMEMPEPSDDEFDFTDKDFINDADMLDPESKKK